MRTIKISACILLLLWSWGRAAGQFVLEDYPVFPATTELRSKLVDIAESQVGVREKTGHNDGKEIRMYLSAVGLKEGNPYCAAGMAWCHDQLDIPHPASGYSPDWFRANVVFSKFQKRITPFEFRPGQVCGFYIESKGRIGHVGMIVSETRFHYETVEFNTNSAGSDEGQGVNRLIRRKDDIDVISDFVGWREYLEGVKEITKNKK